LLHYCLIPGGLLRLEMDKLAIKMSINAIVKKLSEAKQVLNFYINDPKK
jgi:hypothetical protein